MLNRLKEEHCASLEVCRRPLCSPSHCLAKAYIARSFCSVSQTGRKIPAAGSSAWQFTIHQLHNRFRQRVKHQCRGNWHTRCNCVFAVTAITGSLCHETRSDGSINQHLTFTLLWKRPN